MVSLNRFAAALVCIAALLPQAAAQPGGKVMRIVVPFAAGGAREVLARTFYSELGIALGQTAIIENRPGAGGAIGTASVAKAAPDGQTLIFAASSHNVTALLGANPPYDPIRDFAAVANIGMQSYVLMASAAVPARTAAEFVEYARSNPGRLNYASAGHGSSGHLALAKTPQAVIARINAEVAKLLRDPVILGRLARQGVEPRALSPAAFERLIREDYDDMARLVKAVGRIE